MSMPEKKVREIDQSWKTDTETFVMDKALQMMESSLKRQVDVMERTMLDQANIFEHFRIDVTSSMDRMTNRLDKIADSIPGNNTVNTLTYLLVSSMILQLVLVLAIGGTTVAANLGDLFFQVTPAVLDGTEISTRD